MIFQKKIYMEEENDFSENDFSQSSKSEHFFGHLIHVELSHVPPQKVSVS